MSTKRAKGSSIPSLKSVILRINQKESKQTQNTFQKFKLNLEFTNSLPRRILDVITIPHPPKMPRFILLVKSRSYDPNPDAFAAMGKFNEEMKAAGVMLTGEGIAKPEVDAYQLTYPGDGAAPAVEKGPFTEAYSGVTGFWLIKTETTEDALAWAKKVPFNRGEKVEMRRIMEMCDVEEMMREATKE